MSRLRLRLFVFYIHITSQSEHMYKLRPYVSSNNEVKPASVMYHLPSYHQHTEEFYDEDLMVENSPEVEKSFLEFAETRDSCIDDFDFDQQMKNGEKTEVGGTDQTMPQQQYLLQRMTLLSDRLDKFLLISSVQQTTHGFFQT